MYILIFLQVGAGSKPPPLILIIIRLNVFLVGVVPPVAAAVVEGVGLGRQGICYCISKEIYHAVNHELKSRKLVVIMVN